MFVSIRVIDICRFWVFGVWWLQSSKCNRSIEAMVRLQHSLEKSKFELGMLEGQTSGKTIRPINPSSEKASHVALPWQYQPDFDVCLWQCCGSVKFQRGVDVAVHRCSRTFLHRSWCRNHLILRFEIYIKGPQAP